MIINNCRSTRLSLYDRICIYMVKTKTGCGDMDRLYINLLIVFVAVDTLWFKVH